MLAIQQNINASFYDNFNSFFYNFLNFFKIYFHTIFYPMDKIFGNLQLQNRKTFCKMARNVHFIFLAIAY